jgi:outer membrane receptor protein involved in Fe transport
VETGTPLGISDEYSAGGFSVLPRRLFFLVSAICFLSASVLFAQTENATLSGTITDQSGAVVNAAEIQLTNIETGVIGHTVSNQSGLYVFSNVRPGRYRMTVDKAGFRQVVLTDLTVNVQEVLGRNFSLKVGAVGESVTVSGDAAKINTTDASVSTVVDRQFVENMPLNGRSVQALIDLTPGVVLTSASFGEAGQFSVNGQRSDTNYYTLDGVSANIGASPGAPLLQYGAGVFPGLSASGGTNSLVSVDALQEFRVQTSSFAPEYGRTPGGQIAMTTRSGANQFHGTLFEYFRNDVLDANDWFTNHLGLNKPALRQNDFGGVFSGPLMKDRLFFFFSYEGLRLRLPQSRTVVVPSLETRAGATPAMQAILSAFPMPTGPDLGDGLAQFTGSFSNPSGLDATSLRLDYSLSKKWNLFSRYNYSPSSSDGRGSASAGQENLSLSTISKFKNTTQTLTLGATTVISPRMASEFHFNYSHVAANSVFKFDPFGGAVLFDPSLVFPTGINFDNGTFDTAIFSLPSPPLLALGPISRNKQRQLNFVENISFAAGSHLIKFGIDYRRLSPIQNPLIYLQAAFFLDAPSAAAGDSFVFEVNAAQPNTNFIFSNVSLYGQDTWRVTPRLNLTYGLRWDINPVPGQGNGTPKPYTFAGFADAKNIDPATLTTLAPAGTPLYKTPHHDFAPRIGATYQFSDSANWSRVLRGGFGVFYDISNSVIGGAADGFPYKSGTFLPGPFPNAPLAVPPLLGIVSYPINSITVPDPKLKSPYSLQWNLALEQQAGASQSFAITYVGSVGRRLLYQREFSPANANFNDISLLLNGATSDYNSLQLQFKRELSRGLQALASYSWAHAIDMDSNTVDVAGLFRGPANFDIRHTFTAAVSYELPKRRWNAVFRSILQDWTIELPFHAQSASPVDLVGGSIFLPDGEFFQARPDVVPGQPFYVDDPTAPGRRRINKLAFTQAPSGQGNLGRNALRGIAFWQMDFALHRTFRLKDRLSLQFRSEFFNIFNHPNFGLPVRDLGDPSFGIPINTFAQSLGSGGADEGFNPLYQLGGPRSVQFAVKLQF